ncbi:PHB depolymerase family esterase [Alcanivorax sp. 1008]|uniref:PHB depolymerase family esterase n=1 Tax=Alcanivorax sp. 1008 TaxID=2816853 RepID=UPI001D8FC5F8|nr:PHB depolymerase family esterase [Alcanivorax sp. 1008]MCC1498154.1 hypothetical protein [Alcanivorax sp. 1008]
MTTKLGIPTYILWALVVTLCATAISAEAATPERDDFWHDLRHRGYHYYIPDTIKQDAPLLIVMHGYGGNSTSLFFAPSDLTQLADEQGFVIMWPSASGLLASWNGGPCCPPATTFHVNDNGFIRQAIKRLGNRVSIDETRIYAMGHSNGGSMAHRLGLQSSDIIAAIAPISFPVMDRLSNRFIIDYPIWEMPSSWGAGRKVPVLAMHAEDDDLILYWGACVLDSGICLDSAPAGRDTWGRINECQKNLEFVWHSQQRREAYIESYTDCKQDVSVNLLTIRTGKHSPFSPKDNGGVDVAQEAWSFLSRFQKPGHKSDRMWEGQALNRGQYLESADGSVLLELQADSNLVLKDTKNQLVLWASGTQGSGANRLTIQGSGELVLIKPGYIKKLFFGLVTVKTKPSVVWSSRTPGSGEERVQIDGRGTLQLLRNDEVVWHKP